NPTKTSQTPKPPQQCYEHTTPQHTGRRKPDATNFGTKRAEAKEARICERTSAAVFGAQGAEPNPTSKAGASHPAPVPTNQASQTKKTSHKEQKPRRPSPPIK